MNNLKITIANTFLKSFIGFIGRCRIAQNEAMLFPRCSRVHTYFMRVPIDIVFLNDEDRVIEVFPSFFPWRISPRVKGAVSCLEMASGAAESFGIVPGTKVHF